MTEDEFMEISAKQNAMLYLMDKAKKEMEANHPDSFGGIYFDEAQPVLLLAGTKEQVDVLASTVDSRFTVRRVKNSQYQLENTVLEINRLFGVNSDERHYPEQNGKRVNVSWGIDTAANKVVVMTDDEHAKELIRNQFSKDLYYFTGALELFVEQSSAADPGR